MGWFPGVRGGLGCKRVVTTVVLCLCVLCYVCLLVYWDLCRCVQVCIRDCVISIVLWFVLVAGCLLFIEGVC